VHVARALSANAPLLLADEPVAALDPRHQLRVASLLRNFVNDGGGAVVVLHEVALAAGIADRLVFLNDGYVVAEGAPADILTSATMAAVYGVDAHIHHDERGYDVRITGTA
jgi:iron complex transport system ATP-binding protein